MTVFFTADTHFGHANVLDLCGRPFANIEEHDEALVAAWNAVVRPEDTVYHLGDFAYRCTPEYGASIFARLRGRKHLVKGNHDKPWVLGLGWASPPSDLRQEAIDGKRVVLCHYALRSWPGAFRGAVHLFGHSHGLLPGTRASTDVGVDVTGYAPVRLERALAMMAENSAPQEELAAAEARKPAIKNEAGWTA